MRRLKVFLLDFKVLSERMRIHVEEMIAMKELPKEVTLYCARHCYSGSLKEEQEIAETCNRLIKNCIICWNYLYLSQKLTNTLDQQYREQIMRFIETHSPVAWAHINMRGEYDFSDDKLRDFFVIISLKSAT